MTSPSSTQSPSQNSQNAQQLPQAPRTKFAEVLLTAIVTGIFSKLDYGFALSYMANLFQRMAHFFQ